MTQKLSPDKAISALLQSIDPEQIAEEGVRQTVELLLNLIEQLNAKIKDLVVENQKLRDENNWLKGEEGKPNIKAIEWRKREEGRGKKFDFEMGILTPTQNKSSHRGWGLKPLYEEV